MADILTFVFRACIPQISPKKDFNLISPSSLTCSTLVLGGRSVNHSLLLCAAVTAASELGLKVVFFTPTQIQSLPAPLQSSCLPNLTPDSLKKIKFSYPRTVEELLHQVACLHESVNASSTPPSLIIVDSLEAYLPGPWGSGHSGFHQGERSSVAHLSALLCDTAAFLTQVLDQRAPSLAPCRVIASFQSDLVAGQAGGEPSGPDPILNVLDRYFQVRCTLDRDRSHAGITQEVWRVYLSGTGMSEVPCGEEHKDEAQEWQLAIFPDGKIEFTLV